MLPFDLHVLGLPLAFILSQDQTLHCNFIYIINFYSTLTLLFSTQIIINLRQHQPERFAIMFFLSILFKERYIKHISASYLWLKSSILTPNLTLHFLKASAKIII